MEKYLSRPDEHLITHLNLTINNYHNCCKKNSLDKIIKNVILKLLQENNIKNEEASTHIYEMFINAIWLHDIGKINPYFQAYINNPIFKDYKFNNENKKHSILSSLIYLNIYYGKIKDVIYSKNRRENRNIKNLLYDLLVSFAYCISRHHSRLKDFDSIVFFNKLDNTVIQNNLLNNNLNIDKEIIKKLKQINYKDIVYTNEFTKYILIKLCYSSIVTCDFLAVYNFYNKKQFDINILDNNKLVQFNNKYNSLNIIKSIRTYPYNKDKLSKINKMRTKMFLESESNLIKNINDNIFYLEAPTGSGKSNTSLNLALNILNNSKQFNKIISINPYNAISEQTYNNIKNSLSIDDKDVVLINSQTEIIESDIEDETHYSKDFLDSQLLNYPVSIISHVRLFKALFSNNRIDNLMLFNIINSVIIIDEVQSYKNNLWIHIINSFKQFSDLLSFKIIMMSATLPKMDCLLEDKTYMSNLIHDKDHYYDYFKNRVSLNFDLLNIKQFGKTILCDKIDIEIKNNKRILVEFIKNKTANEIYNYYKQKFKGTDYLVFNITSNCNSLYKQNVLKLINEKDDKDNFINQKILVICTQSIEAGVDIDMDVGFKDISLLDSDEQFCGRINRNFKRKGIVYFFHLDKITDVYKDDYRCEKNLLNEEWQHLLITKQFNKFYELNYKRLLEEEKLNKDYYTYKNNLRTIQFEKIDKTMTLIDEQNCNLYLYCKLKVKDITIDSKNMFNKYIELKKDCNMDYSKKMVKLSKLKKWLGLFTYKFKVFNNNKPSIYSDYIDNYYILENPSEYIDVKEDFINEFSLFDMNKYIDDCNGLFL